MDYVHSCQFSLLTNECFHQLAFKHVQKWWFIDEKTHIPKKEKKKTEEHGTKNMKLRLSSHRVSIGL